MKRLLTGIQPTGEMHIGNYIGAARQWVALQHSYNCLFMVADLHALTTPQDPHELSKATVNKVVELLSVGLDPDKCTLFIQSHVPEHTELAWIFNTITPIAELERMTQFKDKSQKNIKNINAGLLDYPVLMTADILLYKTEAVPVGEDQAQHLELTRLIAKKFNATFGETFAEPEAIIPKEGARIMSLLDPKKKMSKSDKPDTYISLFDSPEAIRKKIAKATTDARTDIVFSPLKKPGISNLLTIYSAFGKTPIKEIERYYKEKNYAAFKHDLSELLILELEPMRRKKQSLENRELYLKEILKHGSKKASSVAKTTMEEVRSKVGLYTI